MPRLEAKQIDSSASCQLPRYFIGIASASEKLPLPRSRPHCLGLANWLIWLMGKPRKTQIDGYGSAKTNPITWAFAAVSCLNQ